MTLNQSEPTFEELFTLDEIQRIQDEFAAATRVASLITRTDGTPITAPSNFTYLCENIIRKTEKGCANCQTSDAVLGGSNLRDVNVMQCLSAGLWDAGVPIIVGGHHVANWLIGQVRDETQTEEKALLYAEDIGADKTEFLKAFRKVPSMPLEQFEKVAQALFTFANEISEKAFQNTQLAQSEARLRELAAEQQAILDGADYAIISTDTSGTIVSFNRAARRMLGYEPEEVIGKQTPEIFHDRDEVYMRGRELSAELGISIEPGFEVFIALPRLGEVDEREWTYVHKDGHRFPTRLSITPLYAADGEISGYVGISVDLTERKQSEEKIENLAYYDQLTGLPNKNLLQKRLEQEIRECHVEGRYSALLLVDVLNFNLINNSLGHRNGDELLKQIAHQLAQSEGQTGTVARLSGDIFAFLFPKIGETELEAHSGVELVADKIFKEFEKTFTVSGVQQHCSVAIGATLIGQNAGTPEELLSEVELAVEAGKVEKDDSVKFYDPGFQSLAAKRAQTEESLRHAIAKNEFELYYQPQISMGNLVGVEALIRWWHPEKGMISPGEFIPVAEETGLIIPIGDWVISEACKQIRRWQKHPILSRVTISVNISAAQMALQNFVDRALNIIAHTKASSHMLKFELTESALVRDSDNVVDKMWALRAAGILFSLDDFGTGYSSLSYLKRLPIEQIKIDQSFVRDLLADVDDATIAKTIINLARDFGMNVIAEGVETEAQQRFLENLGCHTYQGYLYARPMPAKELEDFSAKFA